MGGYAPLSPYWGSNSDSDMEECREEYCSEPDSGNEESFQNHKMELDSDNEDCFGNHKTEPDLVIEECIKKFKTDPDSGLEKSLKNLKESRPEVREFMEDFEILDFVKSENKNGTWKEFNIMELKDDLHAIKIYPNGNKPENEGFVSISFELYNHEMYVSPMAPIIQNGYSSSFQCIVFVVDASGDPRFSQSFGMDLKGWSSEYLFKFRIDRFISRNVMLDSSEELLPQGILKIRCYASLVYVSMPRYREVCQKIMNLRAKNEQWFINHKKWGYKLFNLRNVDSPLCAKLREKSCFFDALFRSSCKEMKDGRMRIQECDYRAFFNMLGYIRTGNVQHVVSDSEHYELYEMADMYGVLGLKEVCSAYFKQQLTNDSAIRTLLGADSVNDAGLRTFAFRRVLSNWSEVKGSTGLAAVSYNRPELAKELCCAAKILNLEDDRVGLGKLASRQVRLNWELVRCSPYWSTFEKKLPDLSKVILCLVQNVQVLNLTEINPADEYKEHAMDYDFYG